MTLLAAEVNSVWTAVGPWGKDRKDLESLIGKLVCLVDGVDQLVFEWHWPRKGYARQYAAVKPKSAACHPNFQELSPELFVSTTR